ncbi:hypothetical protein HOLleu_17302 [Holothuria leucospilota]|uniref:Uncharacterized protein n=1 Tax=Holothuria leucospilota TaxID=206669 RepID=A0A9Q1C712_HOLLE|nr:hypothetical protein HOLleu_17302 [Holothuria leucospilota]
MSSTSRSESLLRRDARLYCQKRNQRILWQTWRDERRSNDSLQRELKYLERSRLVKSRAMDREQGRFLENLVDIFQRQCDIASDRLDRSMRDTSDNKELVLRNFENPALHFKEIVPLPAIAEGCEGIIENDDGINKMDCQVNEDLEKDFANLTVKEQEKEGNEENENKILPHSLTSQENYTHLSQRRALMHTAPPLGRKRMQSRGRFGRNLVSSDGALQTTKPETYTKHNRVKSEERPRTFHALRRIANLSRQRNPEVENFRRQFLVNALSKQLHISAMRSQNFAEHDDIRKKIERKKQCLTKLRKGENN